MDEKIMTTVGENQVATSEPMLNKKQKAFGTAMIAGSAIAVAEAGVIAYLAIKLHKTKKALAVAAAEDYFLDDDLDDDDLDEKK